MLDRQFPFSLYCKITRDTAAGPVETTPEDPEAVITVSVVAEGKHEIQVRDEARNLETQVQVRELSSVTTTGQRVLRRSIGQKELLVPQSALHQIPRPTEGTFVEVPLQHGLRAVVDTATDIPHITLVGTARRSR